MAGLQLNSSFLHTRLSVHRPSVQHLKHGIQPQDVSTPHSGLPQSQPFSPGQSPALENDPLPGCPFYGHHQHLGAAVPTRQPVWHGYLMRGTVRLEQLASHTHPCPAEQIGHRKSLGLRAVHGRHVAAAINSGSCSCGASVYRCRLPLQPAVAAAHLMSSEITGQRALAPGCAAPAPSLRSEP